MRRPSLPSLIVLAVALGIGSGALEVGLRASPQHGLGPGSVGALLAVSIGLATAYLVAAALVGWLAGRKTYGILVGALVLVHGALWYRFEVVLNLFATDPRVWGGMLGVVALAVVVAVVLDPLLERLRLLVAFFALVIGAFGTNWAVSHSAPPVGQTRAGQHNILLVTIDTLRADHLAPYGSSNPTPTLSSLAEEGALFETVVASAPVTEPSHLAIMTGQPPYQSGVAANGTRLGDRPALIWRTLQDAGYTTAGFVSGFPLHSRFGWSQGMDVYDDDFGDFQGLHSLSLVKAWDQIFLPAHTLRERRGDRTVKRALNFLAEHNDSPVFMWVHLFDPHGPYEAPDQVFDPPTDGQALDLPHYWPAKDRAITSTDWLVDAYDAEIRYSDALVGQLIDGLRFYNLLDDTIVVVTADHGESLTEHDYLFDHGDHLYDASLLVPLIIRAPGLARPGHRVPCQVSNEDVTPTLLAMLDLQHSAGQDAIDRVGRDLSGMAAGGPCSDRDVISSTVSVRFVDQPPVDHSLREPAQKLIRRGDDQSQTCFDLVADPGETVPMSCDSVLTGQLDQALAGGTAVAAPQQDSTTNAALEALGYIDSDED